MSLRQTLGFGGSPNVTDASALTSAADVPSSYTEAEVQKLRDDVAALRTKVNELLAALRSGGVLG